MSHSITEAVEAVARGEIVIVTDDDDRENEGDLVVAASLCTPEKMAFIIRHTSGIVCAPLTLEEARRLHLAPMVAENDAPLATAFTVTVDTRHGLTTGISAEQRCNTVRALANGNMGASDFVRPGHVFPLIAKDGGVLMRSGHTEAAVDLCKLAGLPPVGVICELANDDGTVMTGRQIEEFARAHAFKLVSVSDLIAFRQAREKLVERVATFPVQTEAGEITGHAYVTPFDSVQHFAFVLGTIGDGRDVPTRLHRADILARCVRRRRHDQEDAAAICARRARRAGLSARRRGRRAGQYCRTPTATTKKRRGDAQAQWLDVGLGAQILKDLGVSSIRLRTSTSKPRAFVGLSGFGIEIMRGGAGGVAASDGVAARTVTRASRASPARTSRGLQPHFHADPPTDMHPAAAYLSTAVSVPRRRAGVAEPPPGSCADRRRDPGDALQRNGAARATSRSPAGRAPRAALRRRAG